MGGAKMLIRSILNARPSAEPRAADSEGRSGNLCPSFGPVQLWRQATHKEGGPAHKSAAAVNMRTVDIGWRPLGRPSVIDGQLERVGVRMRAMTTIRIRMPEWVPARTPQYGVQVGDMNERLASKSMYPSARGK